MNKKKLIGICIMIFVVIFVAICIVIINNSKNNLEDAKKDLQESQEKYGTVEKETVDDLVTKFNNEVEENNTLNKASTDYLTEYNNQYWYGLLDGVSLVVVSEKYTKDTSKDIVDYMLIYVNKNSDYSNEALSYAKYLIKANYNEVTEKEINKLLEEAKDKASTGKTAYNGKGISVGYLDKDDYFEYQVLRFYK